VEVRLIDGSWSFQSDMDDPEWVDFESLIGYSEMHLKILAISLV
jgi:hypothetical protein